MALKADMPEMAESISNSFGIMFAKIPLTPNQWTVLSVVPAIAGFWFLIQGRMMEAMALFAFSAVMDAIDGGVARVTGTTSRLGAFLDGIVDRVVEGLLLFGLLISKIMPDWMLPAYVWIALLLFAGTGMTSFVRAYADHRKALTDEKKLKKMGGILERAERLILVFAGMVAFFWNPVYLTYAIAAAGVLACLTTLQRIWFVVRNAE
jgi:archaetidylinositol phosphate synthase